MGYGPGNFCQLWQVTDGEKLGIILVYKECTKEKISYYCIEFTEKDEKYFTGCYLKP